MTRVGYFVTSSSRTQLLFNNKATLFQGGDRKIAEDVRTFLRVLRIQPLEIKIELKSTALLHTSKT